MYGVERSVVAFVRDVGIAEGTAMLVVKGSVGVTRLGVVAGGVALLGSSHSVCCLSVIRPCNCQCGETTHLVRVDLEVYP
jgi:hypothetical protein